MRAAPGTDRSASRRGEHRRRADRHAHDCGPDVHGDAGGGPPCAYTIAPSSQSIGAAGGAGTTVTVTTTAGCAWTAASNAAWMTITSGASGTGSGRSLHGRGEHRSAERTGTLTIAGQTFTVTQAAHHEPDECLRRRAVFSRPPTCLVFNSTACAAAHAVRKAAGGASIGLVAIVLVAASVQPAAAQQTISDVLSFLVTNRSIPTDDFVRDEQAAAATRDAISGFLLAELATLPISTSAGGFTYRLDPALGTVMRSSDSFGPFFTERSLTAGAGRSSFGVSYQSSIFANVDGRDLRDGTLVSTASTLRGASEPFDVETVSLRIRTDTMTVSGNIGVADRLDVSAAIPLVRLTLSGQRIDTYRGRAFIQATGSAAASGIGDAVIRAKYNVLRQGGSGLAVGGEGRLPTGNEDNLLGAGKATIKPRLIASFETARVSRQWRHWIRLWWAV